MSPEQARLEDTRAWLEKALSDVEAARILFHARPSQEGPAVFHCQQAAEKAFKAFLAWKDEPFRKTHNLKELGTQVAAFDPSLQSLIDRAEGLTEYAWVFRYPGELRSPTRQEAKEALDLARGVYEAILARLPREARP